MQQPANSDIDILLNAELNTLSSLSSSILEDVDCRLVKFRKGLQNLKIKQTKLGQQQQRLYEQQCDKLKQWEDSIKRAERSRKDIIAKKLEINLKRAHLANLVQSLKIEQKQEKKIIRSVNRVSRQQVEKIATKMARSQLKLAKEMEINNKEQTYIEYGYTTAQEMESFDHSDGESSTDSNVDDSDWKPIWLNYDSIAYSKYLPYTQTDLANFENEQQQPNTINQNSNI